MALTKGITTVNTTLATLASVPHTATMAHVHENSVNGLLVVLIAYQTGTSVSGVTYGGVAMTADASSPFYDGSQLNVGVYYLLNPSPGTANIVVTMSDNEIIGVLAQSFAGASQVAPSVAYNGFLNSPNSQTITVPANAMLMAWADSQYSFDSAAALAIDGTNFSFAGCDAHGAVYTCQWCAHTKNANLTAGSKTVVATVISTSYLTSNGRIVIAAAASSTSVIIPPALFTQSL